MVEVTGSRGGIHRPGSTRVGQVAYEHLQPRLRTHAVAAMRRRRRANRRHLHHSPRPGCHPGRLEDQDTQSQRSNVLAVVAGRTGAARQIKDLAQLGSNFGAHAPRTTAGYPSPGFGHSFACTACAYQRAVVQRKRIRIIDEIRGMLKAKLYS